MSRFRRSPTALVALALLVGSTGVATAPPSPPAIPVIPLPPGSVKARFKVFVEGRATARVDLVGASAAPCVISIDGHVKEVTTYQRGRGVVMEFVRLGKAPGAPVLIQRAGRSGDSSLALKVRTTRTATGAATQTDFPGAPVPICPPISEDLSAGPECGIAQIENASAGLLYGGRSGILRLQVNPSAQIGFEPPDCPVSELADHLASMAFGWPTPAAVERMEFVIPPRRIFGSRKVIVASLTVSPSPRRKGPTTFVSGVVQLTKTDFGTNTVTIRLVRVP